MHRMSLMNIHDTWKRDPFNAAKKNRFMLYCISNDTQEHIPSSRKQRSKKWSLHAPSHMAHHDVTMGNNLVSVELNPSPFLFVSPVISSDSFTFKVERTCEVPTALVHAC